MAGAPDDPEALVDALRGVLSGLPDLELAVLIGSRARGRAPAPATDIDLLVHLAPKGESGFLAVHDAVASAFSVTVDVASLSNAARSEPFRERVVREGRAVIDRQGVWPTVCSDQDSLRDWLGEADELTPGELKAARWFEQQAEGARAIEHQQRVEDEIRGTGQTG